MIWKPGDRAIIVRFDGDEPGPNLRVGSVVTIIESISVPSKPRLAWRVVYQDGGLCKVAEQHLAPIDDPKGSWEDLKEIWTPKGVEV